MAALRCVHSSHIGYVDDTRFTTDRDFVDGVLHHAGMVLHREKRAARRVRQAARQSGGMLNLPRMAEL